MTLQVGRLDLEHDSYHRLSSEVFGSQLKRIAGATPMCVLTRRRGAHMAHTQTDGLHTRHPLERTHTNTHNDTYNCTKKRTYVHGVKHVGAGQEQHRRLCIRFHYGTRLAFHWRLQRPPRPIAISGGDGCSTPHHVVRFVCHVSGVGMVSIVSLLCTVLSPIQVDMT